MVVSFILESLSMVIDFICRSRSIMVVFHLNGCSYLENSKSSQPLAAMLDQIVLVGDLRQFLWLDITIFNINGHTCIV